MKTLFLLVKASLWNQWKLDELKNSKDKKRRRNQKLMMGVFVFLGIMISCYAASSAYGLVYMKMERLIPSASLTFVAIMTMFFTILKTNGILFGYKDYNMLAALPIKTNTLVASRFMLLYLVNLVMSLLVMLPMGIVYGIYRRESFVFYIIWLISIFITPLVPTTIAALIGVLIMAIASKMKHSNAVSSVLSIVFVVGIMVGSMSLTSMQEVNMQELSQMFTMAEDSLFHAYPVSRVFQKAVVQYDWIAFAVFVLGSYLWYRLFTLLTAVKYQSLQSALTAHKKSMKIKNNFDYTKRTKIQAIVRKEWKKFLTSNIYLLNMGMGVIMVLLMTGALAFVPEQSIIKALEESGVYMDITKIITIFGPFLIAGVLGMSSTTCCSLSLEGSNIQQLKALPLKPIEIYNGKILMNLMLLIPSSLLASFLLVIKFGTDVISVMNMFLLPLVFAVFTSLWGMFANIRFPNFDWDNETTVVKQSAASFLGLFGGFVLAFIGGIMVGVAPSNLAPIITWIVIAGVAGICILLYDKIKKSPLPEQEN